MAVFSYGTLAHVAQLATGGWDPYPLLPGWLAAYFVSLTVFDPLAAALLWLRRREGLALGCAVLVTDAAANGYANYVLDSSPGATAGRIGQAVITAMAIALLATSPRVWPWLHPTIRSRQRERRRDGLEPSTTHSKVAARSVTSGSFTGQDCGEASPVTVLLPSTAAGSLRSRAAVRYPTAGPRAGAGAPGRVRLDRLIKFGTQFAIVSGLAALAATWKGEIIASGAVNVAVAIGVAVGGRVGDSSPQTQALTSRLVGLVHE